MSAQQEREGRTRRHAARATVVREEPVPAVDRRRSTLADPDYADCFRVTPGVPGRSAEAWARVVCEEVAGLGGQFVWQGLVWLRLRPAPDRIAGWTVLASSRSSVLLQARGPLLTAQLVVRAGDDHASITTFIRYDRAAAAITWPALSVMHRMGVPILLRQAYAAGSAPGPRG